MMKTTTNETLDQRFEDLLMGYVGYYVGADCGCDECEKLRQEFRDLWREMKKEIEERWYAAALDVRMMPRENIFGKMIR